MKRIQRRRFEKSTDIPFQQPEVIAKKEKKKKRKKRNKLWQPWTNAVRVIDSKKTPKKNKIKQTKQKPVEERQ